MCHGVAHERQAAQNDEDPHGAADQANEEDGRERVAHERVLEWFREIRHERGHAEGRLSTSKAAVPPKVDCKLGTVRTCDGGPAAMTCRLSKTADVRRTLRHGQVVRGEDDRLPGQPQIVEHLQHQGLRRRVDSGKRFIEEIDVGLLQERAGDEDPLLLPSGERPDLDWGEATHAHLGKRGQSILAIPMRDGKEPAGAKRATH